MGELIFETVLATEQDTQALASQVAPCLRAGDVLLLNGEIGTGKSSFCRALIKTLLGPDEDVPSPTFTLVQTYPFHLSEIWHADLYRLSDPFDIVELGLIDAFDTAICLVEWPDRLGEFQPLDALTVTLTVHGSGRHCRLIGPSEWAKKLGLSNA